MVCGEGAGESRLEGRGEDAARLGGGGIIDDTIGLGEEHRLDEVGDVLSLLLLAPSPEAELV